MQWLQVRTCTFSADSWGNNKKNFQVVKMQFSLPKQTMSAQNLTFQNNPTWLQIGSLAILTQILNK